MVTRRVTPELARTFCGRLSRDTFQRNGLTMGRYERGRLLVRRCRVGLRCSSHTRSRSGDVAPVVARAPPIPSASLHDYSPLGSLASSHESVDFEDKGVQNLHPAGPQPLRSRVSVIDQFEEELLARLRELRPLAIEYQQLECVAHRLGLALDDDRSTPPRERKASRKTTSTQRIPATGTQSPPTDNASAATAQASVTSTRQRPRRPSSSSTNTRRAGRQRQSHRQQDVLRLIQGRPGITVKEIATELDVDATNLYRHVRKLQQDGLVAKQGTALQPTSR
jgi:hypothetical protein